MPWIAPRDAAALSNGFNGLLNGRKCQVLTLDHPGSVYNDLSAREHAELDQLSYGLRTDTEFTRSIG